MKLTTMAVAALMTLGVASAQQTGKLQVKVKPGRTGVFVDGKYVGPASNLMRARTYTIPVGEHEVVLREPRYQDQSQKVTITAGKTTTIAPGMQAKELLKPPFGVLRTVGFEKFAAVYVNGHYVGHADEFNASAQGLLLNPGDYDVKITDVNGGTLAEKKVTIREKVTEVLRK